MNKRNKRKMNKHKRTRVRTLALSFVPLCGVTLSSGVMAQSSVSLYGVVDDAFTYVSNQRGHSNFYLSQGNLQASKFGLLGAEELGGGTRAIFRLESGFNSLTGAQSSAGFIFNRQAYVGLNNDTYGTVTLGRQYTPYFNMVGSLGPTGVLTGATGAHPGDLDALDTTLRFNNSVTYASPVLAGLQFSAQYALGGVPGSVTNGSNFSAALRYDYKAFAVAAGYVKLKDIATSQALGTFAINSPVNNGYASAHSAQLIATAARYNFDNLMVGVNYSNVQYAPGSGSLFAGEAVFNTYGVISTYRFTPAVIVGAGYSYTHGEQGEWHQRSGSLPPGVARRNLQLVEAHDALCAPGVSARAGQVARRGGIGRHEHRRRRRRRGRLAEHFAVVGTVAIRRHGRDPARVLSSVSCALRRMNRWTCAPPVSRFLQLCPERSCHERASLHSRARSGNDQFPRDPFRPQRRTRRCRAARVRAALSASGMGRARSARYLAIATGRRA